MSHRPLHTDVLVVASHNEGKVREIRDLVAPHGIRTLSAGEAGLAEPEETGSTFVANARIKSLAAALATGKPALADDSGLVVDALNGDPGIYSARWAGADKDFVRAMRNIEEGLQQAGATTPEKRTARFVAVISLAWPDGHTEDFEGIVEGTLVWPPRGTLGFGYDPMFLPEGHDRTFGEMSAEEKHGLTPEGDGLSHRARAFSLFAKACLGK